MYVHVNIILITVPLNHSDCRCRFPVKASHASKHWLNERERKKNISAINPALSLHSFQKWIFLHHTVLSENIRLIRGQASAGVLLCGFGKGGWSEQCSRQKGRLWLEWGGCAGCEDCLCNLVYPSGHAHITTHSHTYMQRDTTTFITIKSSCYIFCVPLAVWYWAWLQSTCTIFPIKQWDILKGEVCNFRASIM